MRGRFGHAGPLAPIATVNVDVLMQARRDDDFSRILAQSTALNVVDGWPVLWLLRRLGFANARRAPGSDLLRHLLVDPECADITIFLLGDTDDTLRAVVGRGMREGWSARIVGHYSPARSEVDDETHSRAIVTRVNESGARVLIVGFGAPRQEYWMCRWSTALAPRVGLCVGGAMKFVAWPQRRAPTWMQKAGLEWLHRTMLEPWRLGPRYARNFLDLVRLSFELRRLSPRRSEINQSEAARPFV
jgi:N-acetylglucosaminyldiphosphoundecaprenol N-acetyl-beta-D-mannosaminyltransferase